MSERSYHLGLDWGTSTTKLVLRDYAWPGSQYGRAFVLALDGDPRYPSTVALDAAGRIWFGHEAHRRRNADHVWHSLKADFALGNPDAEVASGVTCAEIAILYLAHVLARAMTVASGLARTARQTAKVLSTVSVPTARLEVHSDRYLLAILAADGLAKSRDPQGALLVDALKELRPLLGTFTARLADMKRDRLLAQYRRRIRSEAFSAMVWLTRSPTIGVGPYTVIDVGAATTNASFFWIRDAHDPTGDVIQKGRLIFAAARTEQTGMDRLDTALADASGQPSDEVRFNEDALLRAWATAPAVAMAVGAPHETWRKAKCDMWHVAGQLRFWEGLGILVVGGGSRIGAVTAAFVRPPGHLRRQLRSFRVVKSPGKPPDLGLLLHGAEGVLEDYEFFLVAYGLSFRPGDLPDVSLPGELSLFRAALPVAVRLSSEEMGYDP